MKKIIRTDGAPRPVGPYSQAVVAGGLVFVSGQVSIDPGTGKLVVGDVRTQTRQVLLNISSILEEAGTDLSRVVRAGVFLADMDDFAAMNDAYRAFFEREPPARTTVEAARLPLDARVEIDVVALAGS